MAAGAALDHVVVVDEGGWDELVAAAPVALGPAAGRARPDDGEVLFRGANAFAGSVGHCLVALLVVDVEAAAAWAARHGRAARTPAELAEDETVLEEFARGVAGVNERSGRAEQVRRHVVLGEVWQPDSAVLTPTLKLKRRCVAAVYHDRIEASTTTYRPVGRLTPVDDAAMLTELEPVVAGLVERHLGRAKEWFPHELVPWSRGRDFAPGEAWEPEVSPIADPAVRSSLFVNLLTEDNLPWYSMEISTLFGGDGVWGEWSRRWTAEEGRHSIVIRDYLTVTRAIDPVALERGRMRQVTGAEVPHPASVADGFVYVALQELATRIAHHNTGKRIDDPAGREVMTRVAADENLHYLFYRDLVTAALAAEPSETIRAIERQVREFEMPGTGIPDFNAHAMAIAKAGIYDFATHHEKILVPVVLRHWKVESVEGLDDEAEAAREQLITRIDRIGRAGRRLRERQAESAGAGSDELAAAV